MVREDPIREVLNNSNVITSHVSYKVKENNDGPRMMKTKMVLPQKLGQR